MNNFAAVSSAKNAQTELSSTRVLQESGQLLARRRLDRETGLPAPDSSSSGPDFSARDAFRQAFHSGEVSLTRRRGQLVEVLHLHLATGA